MTDIYEGPSRRQCDKQERKNLSECYEGIVKQLKELNGKVQRHGRWFDKLFKRVNTLEKTDIHDEGVQEGKQSMRASTRNMIITVIMALSCLFAGITIFQRSQKDLVSKLTATNTVKPQSERLDNIENALSRLNNFLDKEDNDGR